MFNNFFKGSVDELLAHVGNAPQSEIDKAGREDTVLNHEEIVAFIMDELKLPKEEAERLATAIQLEELKRVELSMVEKGLLEITEYDADGEPILKPTLKGLMAFLNTPPNET